MGGERKSKLSGLKMVLYVINLFLLLLTEKFYLYYLNTSDFSYLLFSRFVYNYI